MESQPFETSVSMATSTDSAISQQDKASARLSDVVMAESMSLLEDPSDDGIQYAKEEGTPTWKQPTKPTANKLSGATTPRVSTNRAEAVSVERKEELLLEARVNRLQWIHQVPLPYRKADSPDDPWTQEDKLANFLQTCHAAALMPSTTKVLSHLYGLEDARRTPEEVANRIETLLGTMDEDDAPHSFVRPGRQLLEAELAKHEASEVLLAYRDFWDKLQAPECASLVQGMRTAMRNMDSVDEPRAVEEIAERMKTYLNGTFESLKAHAAWKADGVSEGVKHSLESFVYGQCYALVQSKLFSSDEANKSEDQWIERLAALEFVTPKHLDIACLSATGFDLDEALAKPIDALLSADLYFSPYEKLQRILAMWHGINQTLAKALKQAKSEPEKLPSADDILPTIILTLLKAKPARMASNLRMIELFCPESYLRGEAGYAFTNLFSAYQFLVELDMEDPKSLSISAEDFRKGLEDSRAKFKERQETQRLRSQLKSPDIDTEISLKYCDIPASQIRDARRRGETVDLDWAMDWQQKQMAADVERMASGQSTSQECSNEDVLPPGFARTYTFLTARPEDIRISDLPQLLSEYRMLVHTSETLLGERASRLAAERKKKVNTVQEELLANVRRVDPSLLPDNPSH